MNMYDVTYSWSWFRDTEVKLKSKFRNRAILGWEVSTLKRIELLLSSKVKKKKRVYYDMFYLIEDMYVIRDSHF
jgi:hypothetical protein